MSVRCAARQRACAVIVLLIAACGAAPGDQAVPPCLDGDGFAADGTLPLEAGQQGDAAILQALRHERADGCERITLDLLDASGAPAVAAGQVQADVRRDLGVVRVSLLDIDSVDATATDARFSGPLAAAAWVVRSPEGPWLHADIQLAGAAHARVTRARDPARIHIDLRPGGTPLPLPPAIARRVVVLAPRPGTATYPLVVTGHARTFEANVVARLEQEGISLVEAFTTATGYVDAWGHYTLTLDEGPTGAVTLHVGEYSARDGAWDGVAIDLDLR